MLIRKFKTLSRLAASGQYQLIWNKIRLRLLMTVERQRIFWWTRILPRYRNSYELRRLAEVHPKISVLVPNFNHGRFLRRRLESIYRQTYQNLEVILMDDASSDDSRSILTEYAERYPAITKVIFNEKNSGGVFRQWARGLRRASGDLVWIAESDDECDLDFLEKLTSVFRDESVMIAYAPSIFVDDAGSKVWSTEQYLADLDPHRWKKSFVRPAYTEVLRYFSRKNLIANASSTIFRRPTDLKLIDNERWRDMRVCGDWALYLSVARAGSIAFVTGTNNYYRQHTSNTTKTAFQKDAYYREHQVIAEILTDDYGMGSPGVRQLEQKLRMDWLQNRSGESLAGLRALFDVDRLADHSSPRTLIGMCGFAFTLGGGEIFPITLANALSRRGLNVVFLNFDLHARSDQVRARLRPNIPVLNLNKIQELEEIVSAFGIDILHSHHAYVDVLIAKFASNTRHVVTLHGMYETEDGQALGPELPKLVSTVQRFVYISEKNRTTFLPLAADRLTKIDNAIDRCPPPRLSRASLGLSADAVVFCLASRAIAEKGWREAIAATGEARLRTGKDVVLLLVGEGPLLEELRPTAPDFVRFTGLTSTVTDYFAVADVGLLPSYFRGESFPLVVLECLQMGRPVIATAIGEIPEMLRVAGGGLAGSLIQLREGGLDPAELASVMEQYVRDADLRADKSRLANEASRKFDLDVMTERYEEVYRDTLGKAESSPA